LDIKPSPYSAGVFRAYATQLDNVASDGIGRNSPFTKALLQHIGTKGLSIQELMIKVRKSVMADTKAAQVPWEEAALNDVFYFVPATTSGPPSPGAPGQRQQAPNRPANRPGNNNLPPNLGVGIGTGLQLPSSARLSETVLKVRSDRKLPRPTLSSCSYLPTARIRSGSVLHRRRCGRRSDAGSESAG
jgi:Caspase domain